MITKAPEIRIPGALVIPNNPFLATSCDRGRRRRHRRGEPAAVGRDRRDASSGLRWAERVERQVLHRHVGRVEDGEHGARLRREVDHDGRGRALDGRREQHVGAAVLRVSIIRIVSHEGLHRRR